MAEAGADDPLAISITSGNRVILPEPPRTPEAAMRLIEQFVGQAIVRVGVTRYPAGHGISDPSELSPGLVDPCENIRMGTALFGKVHRIVTHARGAADGSAFTQSLEAWRTGMFEGRYVFGEADPGPLSTAEAELDHDEVPSVTGEDPDPATVPDRTAVQDGEALDPNHAGIRIDLSPIGTGRDP
nr:conjugal transfer protein TraH [Xanthobacter dioxanivorans]